MPCRLAAGGGVEDAGELAAPAAVVEPGHDRQDRAGEIGGSGGAAALIGDHPQPAGLARRCQHGADEILPRRRVHPGRSQHDRTGAAGEHRLLAGKLSAAIDAGRARGIGLDIGRTLGAVEDVVGRDMDERNAGIRAQGGQRRRAVAIGAGGRFGGGLGGIDRSPRGGIDHQPRRGGEGKRDRLRPVEVEIGPSGNDHIRPACERPRELAGAAGDQDRRHQRVNQSASRSRRRGSLRSFSDSTASVSATGQGSARSESFQITPRSAAGS